MSGPIGHCRAAHPVIGAIAGLLVVMLTFACSPAPRTTPAPTDRSPAAPAASGGQAAPTQGAAQSSALSAPVSIKIAYSELTPAQAPNWVAYEAGIYSKYGLDAEMLYIQSAQTVAAVLAGEVEIALGGGAASMSSRLGGSDLTIFMALTTWYPYEFIVTPDIRSPADLRGKTIGISRFGSSSDVATRLALQYFGIDPERDVTLIQVGSLSDRMAAMRTGNMAAAVASPPHTTILKRMGFKSLLDLAATGEPALNNVGFARESWLKQNPAVAQAFVDAIAEGIHYAKTNREFTERIIAQYLKLDDMEAAAESYDYFVADHLGRLPDLSIEAGRKFLESQVGTVPQAATAKVEDFFDTTFLDRTRNSGLLERLYGGS